MKRISKIIFALLIGVITIFGVAGCNNDAQKQLQGKIDELQAQIADVSGRLTEMEDELDERNATIDDLNDQLKERDERIEELEKEILSNAGEFYFLEDAYDNGWLTQEDIMSIAYYHNRGRWYNEDIMPENYAPQPKMPEVLSDKTQLKIKSVSAKALREFQNIKNAEADDIIITEYYGTYGDCVAVRTRDNYSGYGTIVFTDLTAGVKFFYGDPKLIQIWRETK